MRLVFAAAATAALAGALVWYGLHETAFPPELDTSIESLSYNFSAPDASHPATGPDDPRLAEIDRDMALLATATRAIRLYSAPGLFESIPPIARKHGLTVMAGAWVDVDRAYTQRQVDAVIRIANSNYNVTSVLVGNETLLRKTVPATELIQWIRYVRQRVRVPISTGETWHVWLEHPELAREVDFLSVHILPYWEGVPDSEAVAYVFQRYDELRKAFPGKKIVIAEFGWPSRGTNNHSAFPGEVTQAHLIREFIVEAHKRSVGYNIIEAIDQVWKVNEGNVGLYWGIYNAAREPKFRMAGMVQEQNYLGRAILAVVVGFILTIGTFALMRRRPNFPHALAVAFAAQALAAGVAMAALYPIENYLNFGSALAWAIGFLLMIPLTVMTLIRVHEAAEITLGTRPRNLIRNPTAPPPGWRPLKVSIHIPAYREPPEMLIQTLESCAALDYPEFEVLVIVNNTPQEELWRPIEACCLRLGERFKFLHLDQISGFKAGALNAALPSMASDAEVIALIDADYVVDPNWLKDLMPVFTDPKIGLVQAPQDHRDGASSAFKLIMNSEYAGFFDIGMVQRNEDNAIITHGTMLLIRRSAFEAAGRWSSDTITEDTEFGLRLLQAGYVAAYTNRRYGWGLLPDTFRAFQVQRDRWAYGAMQIIRKHWRTMLPRAKSLTPAQKFQFVTGWSFWLSDAFGVVAACLNLLWVPVIVFVGVLIPMLPFTLPILALFAVNLLHLGLLYAVRVKLPARQIVGAALAAMSLQMTVARAIGKALWRDNMPFHRTEKGGASVSKDKQPRKLRVAWLEGGIGSALALGSLALYATNHFGMVEINVFAATLAVQSLPFLAAPVMVFLERRASVGDPVRPAILINVSDSGSGISLPAHILSQSPPSGTNADPAFPMLTSESIR